MPDSYVSKVALADGTILIDLTSDTVDSAHLLSGYTAHGANGAPITGACTFDSDTSEDTLQVAEALAGKTFHARGSAYTGTMPNNGAVTGTISSKTQQYTIPLGFHDGTGKVGIDVAEQSKIIGENIRQGITILGVAGSMSGTEDANPQAKVVTPTFSSQVISPDTPTYNYLSQVTVQAITVVYSDNAAGGKTVTIGSVSA